MNTVSVHWLHPDVAECGSDGLSLLPERRTHNKMRQN